jgi:hypothetical protein
MAIICGFLALVLAVMIYVESTPEPPRTGGGFVDVEQVHQIDPYEKEIAKFLMRLEGYLERDELRDLGQ